MAWKDWPAWLKGGLIGEVIGVVLHLLLNFGPLIIGTLTNNAQIMSMSNINISYNVIRIIVYFIIGSVFGALIGWIVGKIKEKK